MQKRSYFSILILLVLVLGCAGQLAIKQITVEPKEVAPGDNAKIFVILKGAKDKVAKIVAVVREAPDMSFSLNNEGKNGDEKAGDQIWTTEVVVPWQANAGIYHLDFSIYDKEDNVLVSKGMEQSSAGRSGSIEVIVK